MLVKLKFTGIRIRIYTYKKTPCCRKIKKIIAVTPPGLENPKYLKNLWKHDDDKRGENTGTTAGKRKEEAEVLNRMQKNK